jgi:hypothetical protein
VKSALAITVGAFVVLSSVADAKGHRYSSRHHIRPAARVQTPHRPVPPPLGLDRGNIYDSDAGGRHIYTNPDRDFFGPNRSVWW